MPPDAEAAVVELPPAETPGIGDPEAPVSPGPVEGAGDEQAPVVTDEQDLDPRAILRDPALLARANAAGVTTDELIEAITAAPPSVDEERIRAEAQKLDTQRREAEEAVRDREQAFEEASRVGDIGKRWVKNRVEQFQNLVESEPEKAAALLTQRNPETQRLLILDALDAAEAGGIGQAALDQHRQVQQLREKHKDVLGQLAPQDEQRLKDARYEDAMKGGARELEVVLDIAIARSAQKAEEKGAKKGAKDSEATQASLSIIERLSVAGIHAASSVNGRGTPPVTRTDDEILMDPKTPIDKVNEIRRRQRGAV